MLALLGGVSIGPLTIPYAWIGLILGGAAGGWIMKRHIRRMAIPGGDPIVDLLFDIVVAWFLGWKFSALVLTPIDAIRHPIALLTLPADPHAKWVGTMAAFLYGGYKWWRLKPQGRDVLEVWPFGLVTGGAVASLFWLSLGKPTGLPWGIRAFGGVFQPVNFYEAIVLWAALLFAWRSRRMEKGAFLLLLSGIGSLLVSLFAVYQTVIFGLSPSQWAALTVSILGLTGLRNAKGGHPL
ncbi:MAG: hypothetical protein ACYCYO_03520 [Bacilli bacterium]